MRRACLTLVSLAFIYVLGLLYFLADRADKLQAEEDAKEAERAERLQKPTKEPALAKQLQEPEKRPGSVNAKDTCRGWGKGEDCYNIFVGKTEKIEWPKPAEGGIRYEDPDEAAPDANKRAPTRTRIPD